MNLIFFQSPLKLPSSSRNDQYEMWARTMHVVSCRILALESDSVDIRGVKSTILDPQPNPKMPLVRKLDLPIGSISNMGLMRMSHNDKDFKVNWL